ncbi:rho guanine nucleotide exchange factor 19-like [Centropristis striata]|uniref:rho guanine nucleotide exchange factor 19-like n=1 Tax=Centropristis striata TaxID=184440 RepID=UPI0027DF8CD4|nr:rho guanine nucleotide exchange factor 19-like [Centropristis striata]
MAQSDCTDENSHCWSSSSILANLHSYFGENHPVNNLISKIQTMKTSDLFPLEPSSEQQEAGGLVEVEESMEEPEESSSSIDISSALKSAALTFLSFSVPSLEEDGPPLSPSDDQNKSTPGAEDPAEEEQQSVSFQSKFINFFPLYQDYSLQAVTEDIHRLSSSFVSELINPQYLQGLQTRLIGQCGFGAASNQLNSPEAAPPPPPPRPRSTRVTPCTLWQDQEEVKASGLLSSLTTRDILLQETTFELIGSEASYLRSLGVAVNHFYASKELKQTLNQTEHHILFSNIRRVMAASEKFLMDLQVRWGESVFLSQVGDVVLQHCPEFHRLYVPYVTNMMYQETLVNQLLQQNREFQCSVKKLENDPVCQRQSLKSFLVLPFQRITRIKLILESILKLTDPGSGSVAILKKAIEATHEVILFTMQEFRSVHSC